MIAIKLGMGEHLGSKMVCVVYILIELINYLLKHTNKTIQQSPQTLNNQPAAKNKYNKHDCRHCWAWGSTSSAGGSEGNVAFGSFTPKKWIKI